MTAKWSTRPGLHGTPLELTLRSAHHSLSQLELHILGETSFIWMSYSSQCYMFRIQIFYFRKIFFHLVILIL